MFYLSKISIAAKIGTGQYRKVVEANITHHAAAARRRRLKRDSFSVIMTGSK